MFYGEGWSMANDEVTGKYTMATQVNSKQTPGFAYFNDSIRDALKGHVFNDTAPGFISGEQGDEEKLQRISSAQQTGAAARHRRLIMHPAMITTR